MIDITLALEIMAVMGVIAYIALLIAESLAVDIESQQDEIYQKRSLSHQHVARRA